MFIYSLNTLGNSDGYLFIFRFVFHFLSYFYSKNTGPFDENCQQNGKCGRHMNGWLMYKTLPLEYLSRTDISTKKNTRVSPKSYLSNFLKKHIPHKSTLRKKKKKKKQSKKYLQYSHDSA